MAQRRGKGDFRVRIEVSPDPKQIANLIGTELTAKISNFKDTFTTLAPELARGLAANMRAGSGPDGESWDPLDEVYVARKLKAGGSRAPLIFSGKSIGHLASAGSMIRVGKRAVSVGWAGPEWSHMPALNFGFAGGHASRRGGTALGGLIRRARDRKKGRGQGARPFVGFSSAMSQAAENAMLGHVQSVLQEAAKRFAQLSRAA